MLLPTPAVRRFVALSTALVCVGAGLGSAATPASATRPGCSTSPERAPWLAGTDPGAADPVPFLSAHRGGTNLAPQQTAEAYRSAVAFGASVIEVDLHVLADGGLASFHDDTAPDGRFMSEVTTQEFLSWNAATGDWAGTRFDPARYLMFEEVLAIARGGDVGLDIEFKDLDPRANAGIVPPYRAVAEAVEAAGLMSKTIWQHHDGQRKLVVDVESVDPDALFNYNILYHETPAELFAKAATQDFSFGSDLAKFTPERLAAIHDGCAIAVPHSYDEGADQEGAQIVEGRARGVDGFQTNQVDVAADALDRPVPSRWVRPSRTSAQACLVHPDNGYGLPGRTVTGGGRTQVTGPGGCVDAGSAPMSFAGDGAALPSRERTSRRGERD